MKHIEKKEFHRARQNKRVIEWQRANKKGLSAEPGRLSEFQQHLKEAQIAKEKAGDLWGCNPPEAKLELIRLLIGRNGNSDLTESYITDASDGIKINSAVKLIDPECEDSQLKWLITLPKYDMIQSFSNLLSVNYIQSVPKAPNGDRGNDLSVDVSIKLFCEGALADNLTYTIKQDTKDQLRQEYLDMGKKLMPERADLISSQHTKHFTIEEFNSSERFNGGKYDYILCKILDKLESVRAKTGDIKMIINSGFRNPYRNGDIGGAKESKHIYGLATDIAREDFNGDNKVDEKDWAYMARAAKDVGACVEPMNNAPTWIHMDWRGGCPVGW